MAIDDTRFWDGMAKGYAQSKIRDPGAYEKKLEITRALFPENADVLEIACGTGTTALRHAPHVRHYRASDVSSAMLDIARQKARDAGATNVSFVQEDIATADWPAAHFDTVLAMSILHLLPDRDAALAKVYETLKPGGCFVSSTICLKTMPFFIPLAIGMMKVVGKAPSTVERLTHDDLVSSIDGAGFVIEAHHRMSKKHVAFIVARKPE